MSGEGEIVGDLAQAALTALAIEPEHGEAGDDGHSHESACLNCGTVLAGSHCHECGQAAHVHRTLGAFFHDLLHGVFHFEGKIWRTLPLLAWNPGKLTREYIDGRRASYVSPIALFLFALFLLFAVVKQVGWDLSETADVEVNGNHITGLKANRAEIARLEAKRQDLIRRHRPTDAIDGEIEGRKSGINAIEKMHDPSGSMIKLDDESNDKIGIAAIDAAIAKAKANPQLAIYRLQSDAYKFAWLLILLSVPFVWLLFAFRRQYGLYDHTVFVTYSLCFMMALLTLATLGHAAGAPYLLATFQLLALLHIYRQVRGTYGLTRFGAIWRTAAIALYAILALSVFAALVFAMGGLA